MLSYWEAMKERAMKWREFIERFQHFDSGTFKLLFVMFIFLAASFATTGLFFFFTSIMSRWKTLIVVALGIFFLITYMLFFVR